eukprot:1590797-Prorocentrum_lima.AAC.1
MQKAQSIRQPLPRCGVHAVEAVLVDDAGERMPEAAAKSPRSFHRKLDARLYQGRWEPRVRLRSEEESEVRMRAV